MQLLEELKQTVRYRVRPEGSIIDAWVQYESLTFYGMYLKDVETAFNDPQRINKHEEMMKREHQSPLYAKKHRELFPQWFLECVNKLKSSNSPTHNEELYNLAFDPIHAELFSGCHVNGVKFLETARDDK
ncbi:hypothetical protein Prudu_016526 [Prunus dulcis]|uniref:DUF4218 domain-containing protein n=1 Tax=Prunus dulcis TaxID=3755 RepID=A0A4Y1RLS5_PRUDU|nr:hypothetical protein Prudu_016526 [Prunus dulcis]